MTNKICLKLRAASLPIWVAKFKIFKEGHTKFPSNKIITALLMTLFYSQRCSFVLKDLNR